MKAKANVGKLGARLHVPCGLDAQSHCCHCLQLITAAVSLLVGRHQSNPQTKRMSGHVTARVIRVTVRVIVRVIVRVTLRVHDR